jgi:hypothetical protein
MNKATHQEITAYSAGSRNFPISVNLAKEQIAHYDLGVQLKSSDTFAFHYPIKIQARYAGGALQGAIHWVGKEAGTRTWTLNNESETLTIPLDVRGQCDEINRQDGSCVDYAAIDVVDSSEKPIAKKRFYLRVVPKNS